MRYVIVDPVSDYAAAMVGFLHQHERRGLAIFTHRGTLEAFRHVFAHALGPCFDDAYLVTDFDRLEDLAARIRADWGDSIEGIIPWDELTIQLGADLGALLHVDWNPPEVIRRFRNKYVMKSHLRKSGRVRINMAEVVEDEEEALLFAADVGRWPLVVKPTEGAGTVGVFIARTEAELIRACRETFRLGRGQVLLEEFIQGPEFVVNGIVDADGNLLVTDVWRYDKRSSHGVDNLYFQTIKVNTFEPLFWPLAGYAAAVVEALELRRAPLHMEVKVDDQGPCLVEAGARFGGGNQPLLASALHGRSLFELAACHYLAHLPHHLGDVRYESYDAAQARIVSGVQTTALARVDAILGLDEVQRLPSFYGIGKLVPPGSPLPQTVNMGTKSYEIYLLHPDAGQVEMDAERVRSLLRYLGPPFAERPGFG